MTAPRNTAHVDVVPVDASALRAVPELLDRSREEKACDA